LTSSHCSCIEKKEASTEAGTPRHPLEKKKKKEVLGQGGRKKAGEVSRRGATLILNGIGRAKTTTERLVQREPETSTSIKRETPGIPKKKRGNVRDQPDQRGKGWRQVVKKENSFVRSKGRFRDDKGTREQVDRKGKELTGREVIDGRTVTGILTKKNPGRRES